MTWPARLLVAALATGLLAPGLPAMGPQGDEDIACDGLAPIETTCDAGNITIFFVSKLRVGYRLPPCEPEAIPEGCYAGDIQLVLEQHGDVALRTCSVLALPSVDFGELKQFCGSGGQIGTSGSTHLTCHSRVWATADPQVSGSGVPGGVGRWGCIVDFLPWES